MYNFILETHSGLRWMVLVVSIICVILSLQGFISKRNYQKKDRIFSVIFLGLMHLQVLVGLMLYLFLSPHTSNFTFNMSDRVERFWSVEHAALMLVAVVFTQIGSTKSKKTDVSSSKFKIQLIYFGIALFAMLVGIPWDRM